MAFKIAEAFVDITARDKKYFAAAGKIRSSIRSLGGAFVKFGKIAAAGFTVAGAAAVGFAAKIIQLAQDQELAEAKLAAVIKSTGGAAGFSAGEMGRMAKQLAEVTNFSDNSVLSLQALLATFVKIQGTTFERATETALNMASVMGTDASSAAIQLGKALNDPIVGVGALAEVGVSFSADQKEMIASFVEMNDVTSAQAIILDELAVEFGGVARAMGETSAGGVTQLKNKLTDIGETLGAKLLPALEQIVELIDKFVSSESGMNKIQTAFDDIASSAGKMYDFFLKALAVAKLMIMPVRLIISSAQDFLENPFDFSGRLMRQFDKAAEMFNDAMDDFDIGSRGTGGRFTKGLVDDANAAAAKKDRREIKLNIPQALGGGGGGNRVGPGDPGILSKVLEDRQSNAYLELLKLQKEDRDSRDGQGRLILPEEEFETKEKEGGSIIGIEDLSKQILAAGAGGEEIVVAKKTEENTKKIQERSDEISERIAELVEIMKEFSPVG